VNVGHGDMTGGHGGLEEEVSDVLFTLIALSNSLDIDLDRCMEESLEQAID